MTRAWIGVDLGGTKILAGAFSSSGARLGRHKRPTPFAAGGRALVRALVEAVECAVADAGLPRSSIAAIGLGSPGPLDPERGLILRSPHLAVRR
ncbi:MAG TPA: ROK family protein, partial [Usitatibacter sp.]|nr:ROK family protein [Usitatibacter sp.]